MDAAATVEMLEALVAIDSTSRNSNLPVIELVEQHLRAVGVPSERLPDAHGDPGKASLVARIGPAAPGGVVLCAHTDTVPVDGQPWDTDPFALTDVGDGWLAGRGTVDMKGFLASCLAALPDMAAAPLTRPIWLALTHDEEVGCKGAPAVAERLAGEPQRPAFVLVGEPTARQVIRSHKGLSGFRTVVHGRDAHSSQPQNGASAIEGAAAVVRAIYAAAREQREEGLRVEGFSPAHTTMSVGQISGGTAINIIPRECEIIWEFRAVPGEDVQALTRSILARIDAEALVPLRQQYAEASITTEVIARSPALAAEGNAEAAGIVAELTGAAPGTPVAFGTDGAAIQAAGLPTVLCGPGRLDQMHQPNERIEVADLADCDANLRRFIEWACQPMEVTGP